jgi:hypothetical protein
MACGPTSPKMGIARPAQRSMLAPDRADPHGGHHQTRPSRAATDCPLLPHGFARSRKSGLLRGGRGRCRFSRWRSCRCRCLRRRSWLRCFAACRSFTPRLPHHATDQRCIIFAAVSVGLNHHKNRCNDDQNQNNSHEHPPYLRRRNVYERAANKKGRCKTRP